jgi:hypothetical protein
VIEVLSFDGKKNSVPRRFPPDPRKKSELKASNAIIRAHCVHKTTVLVLLP